MKIGEAPLGILPSVREFLWHTNTYWDKRMHKLKFSDAVAEHSVFKQKWLKIAYGSHEFQFLKLLRTFAIE